MVEEQSTLELTLKPTPHPKATLMNALQPSTLYYLELFPMEGVPGPME
jgi:hypothetical protein